MTILFRMVWFGNFILQTSNGYQSLWIRDCTPSHLWHNLINYYFLKSVKRLKYLKFEEFFIFIFHRVLLVYIGSGHSERLHTWATRWSLVFVGKILLSVHILFYFYFFWRAHNPSSPTRHVWPTIRLLEAGIKSL